MAFFNFFKRSAPGQRPVEVSHEDRGFLVFENTSEVIQAENRLKKEGWHVQVMGPPPEIHSGCDLVITFPLIEELNILRLLEQADLTPLSVVPVTGPLLEPVGLFQVKDFGEHLMVRAANMKLVVEKKSRRIVNISGGGCPDVPYLAQEMVGRTLDDAPRPRDIGHTLCGYALELAFAETLNQCAP
ncbi:hypothetical protein DSCO28_28410 [Desulfosarcina ovata subsp. sediminis]|uniref:Uncharacterized protein n=1 Tax=Desulfosarcina ovata subsp. sediminis TaxID=885957 RepID=A0A5K7ZNT4_9BACT|nr:hypothetical protein DSCO28_28410 [Desulfosarcina ovata subsp. sediminis]